VLIGGVSASEESQKCFSMNSGVSASEKVESAESGVSASEKKMMKGC
jgi:hypothetical protein